MDHRHLHRRGQQRWLFLAIAVFVLPHSQLQAEEKCNGSPVQYVVQISVGEGDTPETLRASALQQAQEEIIHQYCGSEVASTTTLEDSMVASHRVLDVSRGLITSLKQLDKGRFFSSELKERPGTIAHFFEVRVEATPQRLAGNPDPEFRVNATLDKSGYTDGDTARMQIELNKAAYVYVFSIGWDSSIALLYPTRLDSQDQRMAGTFQVPPADGIPFRMATLPTQKSKHVREFLLVVATKKPIDLQRSGINEAVARPRSIDDTASQSALAESLLKLRRDQVAETAVSYELYRRSPAD